MRKAILSLAFAMAITTPALSEESGFLSDYILVHGGLSSFNGGEAEFGSVTVTGDRISSFYGGVAVGSETSSGYIFETDFSLRSYSDDAVLGSARASSDSTLFTVMANGYADLGGRSSKFTPYTSYGIGVGNLNYSESGVIGNVAYALDDSDFVFAYQVGIGSAYRIEEDKEFVFGYRYFGTTSADIAGITISDINSHELYFGVKFAID